jgi:hypothetical protein
MRPDPAYSPGEPRDLALTDAQRTSSGPSRLAPTTKRRRHPPRPPAVAAKIVIPTLHSEAPKPLRMLDGWRPRNVPGNGRTCSSWDTYRPPDMPTHLSDVPCRLPTRPSPPRSEPKPHWLPTVTPRCSRSRARRRESACANRPATGANASSNPACHRARRSSTTVQDAATASSSRSNTP